MIQKPKISKFVFVLAEIFTAVKFTKSSRKPKILDKEVPF